MSAAPPHRPNSRGLRIAPRKPARRRHPGVNGAARLDVGPLRPGFFEERAGLRELFPRGVDLVFVCGDSIAALPRTTIVGA